MQGSGRGGSRFKNDNYLIRWVVTSNTFFIKLQLMYDISCKIVDFQYFNSLDYTVD